MLGFHQLVALIAQPAVHLLQAHTLRGFEAYGKIGRPGPGLPGLGGRKGFEVLLAQNLALGQDLLHILHAGRADIVSPLVRVAVHLYQRALMKHLGKLLEITAMGRLVPIHQKVDKAFRRKDSVQVQITQSHSFHLKLAALLAGAQYLVHIRGHNVIHLPADPHLVEVLVGIVVLDQSGNFQQGRIVCKILILNFIRTGMNQFPKEPDIPFHQMRHPPARLPAQVAVQLFHQL